MFRYEQSTGRLVLQRSGGSARPIAYGYAGHARGINAPEMEHEKGIGPIPRGVYRLIQRDDHPRFAAPCFFLRPTEATAEKLAALGRSGFFIHGDNARGDRSASYGCIVIPRVNRLNVSRLLSQGYDTLEVVR